MLHKKWKNRRKETTTQHTDIHLTNTYEPLSCYIKVKSEWTDLSVEWARRDTAPCAWASENSAFYPLTTTYICVQVTLLPVFCFLHSIRSLLFLWPCFIKMISLCLDRIRISVYTGTVSVYADGCVSATCLWICLWDLPVCCVIVSVLVYNMNPTSTETKRSSTIFFLLFHCVYFLRRPFLNDAKSTDK